MSSVSSSSQANSKISVPSQDESRVRECAAITEELLAKFAFLKAGPDVMYWLMATWGAESGWKLYHNHGSRQNPVYTSLHYTPSTPAQTSVAGAGPVKSTGTLIGNGYQYSPVIQNIWNDPNVSAQTRANIKEGWYPHGISACMGTYHVKGCPNNLGEWRYYKEAQDLIDSLKLEVDPGQSIFQTLFPTDDTTCRRKSIASGMIIFNFKYRQALQSGKSPSVAMQQAVGCFLGKFGTRDANGVSPEMRVAQLNATSGGIVDMLTYIKIVRTGDQTVLSPDLIDMASREAKDRGSNKVTNNPPKTVASTNGGSDGKSAKRPGCDVV